MEDIRALKQELFLKRRSYYLNDYVEVDFIAGAAAAVGLVLNFG